MNKLVLGFALLSSSISINAAEVDFDVTSGKMYAAYMNARNGVVPMMQVENECWDSVKNNLDTSKVCMALGLSGVIIEKTYSRAQGRSPVPNYQADIFWGRAQKKMISAGFNDEKIAEAAQYIVGNLSSVVSGLANAGMR